jgi:hypothetical protein
MGSLGPKKPLGALLSSGVQFKLARDCSLSFNIDVDWATAIASKLCSYRVMSVVHMTKRTLAASSGARRSAQEPQHFSEQQFGGFFGDVMAGGQRLATHVGGDVLPFLERLETAPDRAFCAP